MRSNWLAAGTMALSLIMVGAGAANASTIHKTTTTTHPEKKSTTTTTKPKKKKKASNGVGTTQVVENQDKQYEAVKLVAVIDPAQGADSFTTPDTGKRFVAVEIQVTNRSNGTDSSDANNNLTVVGSNKQDYDADFDAVSECTDFNNGAYNVSKGESQVGCVTYQIPTGVGVAKVQYNPNSGFSTNNAEWTLNPAG